MCSFTISEVVAKEASKESIGEKLFKNRCSNSHPNGGSVVTVTKTRNPKDYEAGYIKTKEDIIRLMRNPGSGSDTLWPTSGNRQGQADMIYLVIYRDK